MSKKPDRTENYSLGIIFDAPRRALSAASGSEEHIWIGALPTYSQLQPTTVSTGESHGMSQPVIYPSESYNILICL